MNRLPEWDSSGLLEGRGVNRPQPAAEMMLAGQNHALELIATNAPLEAILEFVARFIESRSSGLFCSLLLLVDGHLRHGAAPSLPEAYNRLINGIAIGPSVGSCGTAAFTGRPVVVTDIANDPLWADYREVALANGLRACWSTPIRGGSGEILGTFAMYYAEPGEPRPADLHLVEVATHIAGIAIAHHRADQMLAEQARQLEDANRHKDEFLALLGHELRNPLAPITAALELLRIRGDDPPQVEKFRQVIERQVRQLARLVDDLLDISRITHGDIPIVSQATTAAEVIAAAVEAARPLIEQHRHRLEVSTPDVPLPLDADPIRLAQVLSNLLNNAAKFTEPGGTIALRASGEGGEIVIRIRDSGIGVPSGMLTRIFDPFVQAGRTPDRAQGGLGIGLTLARRLVELHGGRIEAHSGGTGQGSEFVVRLPAGTESGRRAAVPGPVVAGGIRRRVLVVDDNVDAADSLAEVLKALGHQVEVAHEGTAALAAASNRPPEVVLLDLGLPGMDGYEVARRLRTAHPGDSIRLIALTGYGQEADRARARQAGFDVYLVKPADLDGLLAAIESPPGSRV
jgi:signal transduction histidine kinase/ActR/RegA family two-component response regulator